MAQDRIIPVRFSPGDDEVLYRHLLAHKEKTASGGQSGEAKRLMRDGLRYQKLMAAGQTGHPGGEVNHG